LTAYGIPPELVPDLRTWACCPLHPTWEVQALGGPFAEWWPSLSESDAATAWEPAGPAGDFAAVIARLLDRETGAYVEDVPGSGRGLSRRRVFALATYGRNPTAEGAEGERAALAELHRMAGHALDGGDYHPAGGRPASRTTLDDVARVILRLASERPTRKRPPWRTEVAAVDGMPAERGLRKLLRHGAIAWPTMCLAAAFRAERLDRFAPIAKPGRWVTDLYGPDDLVYLALSGPSRDWVKALLRKAAEPAKTSRG
jgi:hypothetical protein